MEKYVHDVFSTSLVYARQIHPNITLLVLREVDMRHSGFSGVGMSDIRNVHNVVHSRSTPVALLVATARLL